MTSIEFSSKLLSLEHSLLNFAYRLNLKRDDAKDLVQETYLRVLTNREKYVDSEKFKSWTFTIMKNTFVDNYRRNFRKNIFSDQTVESFFINQTEPTGTDNPDSEYSAREITQRIDQLQDKLRVPLKMYINGYKYTEIAQDLKVNLGTVKKRIFLSRKQLMTQISR